MSFLCRLLLAQTHPFPILIAQAGADVQGFGTFLYPMGKSSAVTKDGKIVYLIKVSKPGPAGETKEEPKDAAPTQAEAPAKKEAAAKASKGGGNKGNSKGKGGGKKDQKKDGVQAGGGAAPKADTPRPPADPMSVLEDRVLALESALKQRNARFAELEARIKQLKVAGK